MSVYFIDYAWKEGTPYGIHPLERPEKQAFSYRIVSDPYGKRFSIEKYRQGVFLEIVYDSLFLDFRKLQETEYTAWQKIYLKEEKETSLSLLKDQNDRALFLEAYFFEGDLCRECRLFSAHGYPLSLHRMFYQELGDPFDGVILFDSNRHPVWLKTYEKDPVTKEFGKLLRETGDVKNAPEVKHAQDKIFAFFDR